jgi:hypothetical protein
MGHCADTGQVRKAGCRQWTAMPNAINAWALYCHDLAKPIDQVRLRNAEIGLGSMSGIVS